jgi:hypothetical protein
MGYFANVYLVEVEKIKNSTQVKTTVYGGEVGGKAYFSWGQGKQPPGQLHSLADGTLFSDKKLIQLSGYPAIEKHKPSESFLLDVSFTPRNNDDPVVFHLVFKKHYVPKRDGEFFEQPCTPSISKNRDKLVITYGVQGPAAIRFPVMPIPAGSSLESYDIEKLVRPDEPLKSKRTVGINLYFFKFEWQFGG